MQRVLTLFPAHLQARLDDVALLVLRLVVGLSMLGAHGWGKLSNFAEYAERFPDPLGVGSTTSLALAVFAEFFCSIAVALGLFTRLAVIPLMVTMTVAVFVIHADDPFAKKELGLLYLVSHLLLFARGAGRLSIDGLLLRRG